MEKNLPIVFSINEDTLISRCSSVDVCSIKKFLKEFFYALSMGEEVHIRGFGRFYLDINKKSIVFTSDNNSKIIKSGVKWILYGENNNEKED